jgi:hypothetical protein
MASVTSSEAARALASRRWHKPENIEVRVQRLEEHIRRVVESAAPPTPEQIERLRALLPPVDRPNRTGVAAA